MSSNSNTGRWTSQDPRGIERVRKGIKEARNRFRSLVPESFVETRDLINNSGSIIDQVDYSAFGTALEESSLSNGDRMTDFAGLERDAVMGLNLAVERVENPGTGRWGSQDPIGFAGGDANIYRYVGNSPGLESDDSGLAEPSLPGDVRLWKVQLHAGGAIEDFRVKDIETILNDEVTRAYMIRLFYVYAHRNNKKEVGMQVLWNRVTGEIKLTTRGVTPGTRHGCEMTDPQLPGWTVILRAHTHYGSGRAQVRGGLRPSTGDYDLPFGWWATFNNDYYQIFLPRTRTSNQELWDPIFWPPPLEVGDFPNPPGSSGPTYS